MKKIIMGLSACFLLLLSSCQKEDLNLYQSGAFIQFFNASSLSFSERSLSDTTRYFSFYFGDPAVTVDTAYFRIYVLGGPTATDRAYQLRQVSVPGAQNAVEGEDYFGFDDPQVKGLYVVKAGEVSALLPIVMKRSARLKTENLSLTFEVVGNENFKAGESNNLSRKLIFNDRLLKPTKWDRNFISQFGEYSVAKHTFMIQTTGDRWDDAFIQILLNQVSLTLAYKSRMQRALGLYNTEHPTAHLLDENGREVRF